MSVSNNSRDESKNLSQKRDSNREIYTSFNSLGGRAEVKSVSQAMHDYITNGFAKLKSPENKQ